jgi:hypothetical protein
MHLDSALIAVTAEWLILGVSRATVYRPLTEVAA